MATAFFQKGEIVLYNHGREDVTCIVLEAYYYGREFEGEQFKERYVIRSLEPENYNFNLHTNGPNGMVYYNTNMCAGEFLKKTNQKIGGPRMHLKRHKIV